MIKYYYLYKTTNILNGKIYIGIHSSNSLENNYLGSGVLLKQSIKKYGKKYFIKEILIIKNSYEEILKEERQIVNKEFCERRDTYNLEIGGKGGKIWTDQARLNMSKTIKKQFENGRKVWSDGIKTGSNMSDKNKKILSEKMTGSNNHMFGINVANLIGEEKDKIRRNKISISNKKPKQNKEKYSIIAKSRIWIVNSNNKISAVFNENDPKLNDIEWKRGRKWK